MDEQRIVARARRWIESVVIGLDLCPFARRVFEGETIRYVVTAAPTEGVLIEVLAAELRHLASAPRHRVETTLLIHPCVLQDFGAYCDFLGDADRLVDSLSLRGVIQIASFHPQYQFAETTPDAVENYTNRSPDPMLHMLREASITAVAGDPAELDAIPQRNIAKLRKIGTEGMRSILRAIAI